jgi:hypothetical protein
VFAAAGTSNGLFAALEAKELLMTPNLVSAKPTTVSNTTSADSAERNATSAALSKVVNDRREAVQTAQGDREQVATLEQRAPSAAVRAELPAARRDAARSGQAATQSIQAELTLARQTLSPSMSERYEQDLRSEYAGDKSAQALVDRGIAKSDAAAAKAASSNSAPGLLGVLAQFVPMVAAKAQATSAPRDRSPEEIKRVADKINDEPIPAKRAMELAKAAEGLNAADRAELVAAVLAKNPGSGPGAMTAETFEYLRKEGYITDSQYAAAANGFVDAANRGLLSKGDDTRKIDEFLQINAWSTRETAAADIAFLGTADKTRTQYFLEDYGRQVFADMAEYPGAVQAPAAEATMQLLSRFVDKKSIAEIYAGFDAAGRQNILEGLGRSDAGFYVGDKSAHSDGLAILIDAVGSQTGTAQAGPSSYIGGMTIYPYGPKYDDLAVEIAKFAETSDDRVFYDGIKPRDARAEALGTLFTKHSDAILDKLTDHALAGSDGGAVEDQVDKIQLANLLRLTALNPDNSHNAAAENAVNTYFDRLSNVANDPRASSAAKKAAEGRLEALVRAEVLVPAQIYADGIEQKQTDVTLYKFAVDGVVKLLNYGAGKLPPGADKLAKQVIKMSAGKAKEAIENQPWKGLDPFLAALEREIKAQASHDDQLEGFGILDDVQLEISDITQRLKRHAYKEILHSEDVPGQR